MSTVADQGKLEACANFLINERGYVVVGLVHGEYDLGQVITKLWNVEVGQPLRVIAITDIKDWNEQRQIASGHFDAAFKTNFYLERDGGTCDDESSSYYRLVTD